MERTFLSWNITNWITVLIMVYLGWALFAGLSQLWKNWGRSGAGLLLLVPIPALLAAGGFA